jgi:hypothetical protein
MQNPAITDYQFVGDLPSLGNTVLTDLARSFEQFPSDDLSMFFARQQINDRSIVIERRKDGLGVAALVDPGQPDTMTNSSTVDRRVIIPVDSRESDFVPQHIINDLRKLGTLNEKAGKEFMADRVKRLVDRSSRLFEILRAQALQGGINYTDPRTMKNINVNMQVPGANFKSLVPYGALRTWDAIASATPVKDLSLFKQYMYQQAKTRPTHIIMRSKLKMLLNLNAEILRRQETAGVPNSAGFLEYRDGEIYAINGMKIVICDTLFEDPTTGTIRHVWPLDKVAVLAQTHQSAPGEVMGRMTYCIGENPDGNPGPWMRISPDTMAPSAPGRAMQYGNSGMPWLKYPEWLGILTVGVAATLDNAIDTLA